MASCPECGEVLADRNIKTLHLHAQAKSHFKCVDCMKVLKSSEALLQHKTATGHMTGGGGGGDVPMSTSSSNGIPPSPTPGSGGHQGSVQPPLSGVGDGAILMTDKKLQDDVLKLGRKFRELQGETEENKALCRHLAEQHKAQQGQLQSLQRAVEQIAASHKQLRDQGFLTQADASENVSDIASTENAELIEENSALKRELEARDRLITDLERRLEFANQELAALRGRE